MRYIPLLETAGPITNGQIDQTWLDAANALIAKLKTATTKEERDEILEAKANEIWGQLKPWLLSLSHDKCWFSEAADHFSNRDVEHFRPKKACKRKVGQKKPPMRTVIGGWPTTGETIEYAAMLETVRREFFFPSSTAVP